MASEKRKAKSVNEFIVIKTFSGSKGELHRVGDVVSFGNKKNEVHMLAMGYVEQAKPATPTRKSKTSGNAK